eukprot:9031235-Pyramimonas_sp.AAC.1
MGVGDPLHLDVLHKEGRIHSLRLRTCWSPAFRPRPRTKRSSPGNSSASRVKLDSFSAATPTPP